MSKVLSALREGVAHVHLTESLINCGEKRLCRQLAQRFFDANIPAFASVGYPERCRAHNLARPDECDLVIQLPAKKWLWVECKIIWKGKGAAAHYLAQEAVRDPRKLDRLGRPEASHVGVLMVGLDRTIRETARLGLDVEGWYTKKARLGSWHRQAWTLKDAGGFRVSVWLWWRPVGTAA